MAYRIIYGTNKEKGKRKKGWILCASVAGWAVLGFLFHLTGADKTILDFLIPGEAAVTEAALMTMIQSLQNGVAVREAFYDFCREIIEHAQMY